MKADAAFSGKFKLSVSSFTQPNPIIVENDETRIYESIDFI